MSKKSNVELKRIENPNSKADARIEFSLNEKRKKFIDSFGKVVTPRLENTSNKPAKLQGKFEERE